MTSTTVEKFSRLMCCSNLMLLFNVFPMSFHLFVVSFVCFAHEIYRVKLSRPEIEPTSISRARVKFGCSSTINFKGKIICSSDHRPSVSIKEEDEGQEQRGKELVAALIFFIQVHEQD